MIEMKLKRPGYGWRFWTEKFPGSGKQEVSSDFYNWKSNCHNVEKI